MATGDMLVTLDALKLVNDRIGSMVKQRMNVDYEGSTSGSAAVAQVTDINGDIRHQIYARYDSSLKTYYTFLNVRNDDGTITNNIGVGLTSNGEPAYVISNPAKFRDAIQATPAGIGAKALQTAVTTPAADGTDVAFISTINQNAQGVISVAKKTVREATATSSGLMSSSDKAKLNGIAEGAQKNTVTGIKGSAEGSYRTGNVNLTPANIGALPSSGGTATGTISRAIDFSTTDAHATPHVNSLDSTITTSSGGSYIRTQVYTTKVKDNSAYYINIAARYPNDSQGSTSTTNEFGVGFDSSGNPKYFIGKVAPLRSALGLGTDGALPITIAQGGTGSTGSSGARFNLEVPYEVYIGSQSNNWQALYDVFSNIRAWKSAFFACDSTIGKMLSKDQVSTINRGRILYVAKSGTYYITTETNNHIYHWTITDFTGPSQPTISNMYVFTGTAVTL